MSNLAGSINSLPPPPPQLLRHNTPNRPTPLSISSRQAMNHKSPRVSYSPALLARQLSKDPLLHHPRPTHPLVWCSAIICLVFCLLLISFGVATLIVFLVIKPKYPSFDITNANLNAIYFDSPENFNGDFTLLANFTNSNRKMKIRYEYLDVELYFGDRLIATQALQPFSQRPGEARLEVVHLISSLVYLPPNPAIELQRQVQSNRVRYNIRGTFRITATVGSAHFSYWLHAKCQLEMTSPPSGVLVARICSTKR